MMRRTWILIAMLFLPIPVLAGMTTLDPDGGLRLDGERWFPLGIYEVPKDASDFKTFSDAGFDLVRGTADASFLDLALHHDIQVWIPLGGFSEVPDEAAKLKMMAHINPVQNHPALAIWEHPDEALWNCEQLRREANEREREEIRQKVNAWIRGGTGDAELLKDLYRRMAREHAFRNWKAEEEAIAELWKTLGETDRAVATRLSDNFACEQKLFDDLLAGYRTLRSTDPLHLVWQNHAPRNSHLQNDGPHRRTPRHQ